MSQGGRGQICAHRPGVALEPPKLSTPVDVHVRGPQALPGRIFLTRNSNSFHKDISSTSGVVVDGAKERVRHR